MTGTGDPINVAAENCLLILSECESIIDACAAETYDGDLLDDLSAGDAEAIRRAEIHVEETFSSIAIVLAQKLLRKAFEAEQRIVAMLEEQ